jgi:hypothetical protein
MFPQNWGLGGLRCCNDEWIWYKNGTIVIKIPSMRYPSFSLVLETENLEVSDIEGLQRSIASLAQQASIAQANEAVILLQTF